MNRPISNTSSIASASANCTINRLNRIGLYHFHHGSFSKASECFLSAIKSLKQLSLAPSEDYSRRPRPAISADDCSATIPTSRRSGSLLQPLELCNLSLDEAEPFSSAVVAVDLNELYSRYTWVSFILIFNLAATVHHQACTMEEGSPPPRHEQHHTSREMLLDQALRLYQCAYQGISNHDFSSSPLCKKSSRTQHIILGQQLQLSVLHNMGLLLTQEEALNEQLQETGDGRHQQQQQLPSAHRCFQLVFAVVHSLRDYYGIGHDDFPADFDLQLAIDVALDHLHHNNTMVPGGRGQGRRINDGGDVHFSTAPCA